MPERDVTHVSPELRQKLENIFDFAARQLTQLTTTHPDQFPMYTANGRWTFGGDLWTNWCEGFLGGQLWLLARHFQSAHWQRMAEHYSRLIEQRKHDRNVHDLGFLFWSTYKQWLDVSGDPALKEVLITAGRTMGYRFQEKGAYLRSFLSQDSLFIDIMMNVGILFYAAMESQDEALLRIGHQHCMTTRKYLVRGDGSTAHEGIFDLNSGEFLRQSTQQGWRADSSWARGTTWAIYGFATAYSMTGRKEYLDTSQACADFYLERTPPHGVPPNDWDEPDPPRPYESSAAAIAASGLWTLAKLTSDPARAGRYRSAVLNILRTLTSAEFIGEAAPGWEGLLKHGVYHERKQLGVDESVMWGDFFFLEAVWKVLHD